MSLIEFFLMILFVLIKIVMIDYLMLLLKNFPKIIIYTLSDINDKSSSIIFKNVVNCLFDIGVYSFIILLFSFNSE